MCSQVGEEAAEAMKVLQKDNRAFANRVAYNQILADLDHEGPLAPGFPAAMAHDGPPLFARFDPVPVAAASLGQVCALRDSLTPEREREGAKRRHHLPLVSS